MAVSFVASSRSGASDNFAASNTCPVPAGAASGDIALLAMECFTGGGDPAKTPTWPTGFTGFVDARQGGVQLLIAWKRLSGADTGNYVTSWSGNIWNQSDCILIRGAVASGTPVASSDSNNTKTGSGTSITATSGSSVGEPFLAHFVAKETGSSTTPPSSFTETQEGDYVQCSYRIPASTGSHTATGATISVSGGWASALVIVEPAGGFDGAVSGTVPVSSAASGGPLATRLPAGTVPVVSAVSGSAGVLRPVSGTVPVSSAVAGAVTIAGGLDAAGTIPVQSDVSGTVQVLRPVSGTVAATTATSGTVQALRPVAGTVAVQSEVSGTADVAGSLSASGSVVVQSTVTGAPLARYVVSGTVGVVSAAAGAPLALLTAAGTVQAVSAVSGVAGRILHAAGAVPVVSTTTGAANVISVGDATPAGRPRLALSVPRSLAVLTLPRSLAALAIPTSRAEITPMDGYTRNDTGPDLTMTLTSTPAQTFTGAAAVVHVRKPGGQTLTKTPQDFNTATGVVTIRWVAGDLDQAGLYEAECQVTYSNGQIQTFGPASFVVRDELG